MARSISKPAKQGTRVKRVERVRGLTRLTNEDESPRRDRRDDNELVAKTDAQDKYIRAINSSLLTFGIGPAGTGKTFIATSIAAQRLDDREVDKIIITRPVVEAGEKLGFLPGELDEKVAPYFAPVLMILERRLGKSQVEMFMKSGRIEFLPLAYMRGHTLEKSFIILDEAQNTTPSQMKMFLTRIGEDSTVVVDGDITQKDIVGPNGLVDAFKRLKGLRGTSCVEFTKDDVVRSGLVADIVGRYEHIEEEEDRRGLNEFLGSLDKS